MSNATPHEHDSKREAILDAAREHFLRKGFNKTSLADIAREAEVTKSLIHHHFESKSRLWQETLLHIMEPYFREQREILLASEEAGLTTFIRSYQSYFTYLKANPCCMRMMMWDMMEKPLGDHPDLVGKELVQMGVEKIRNDQKRGELRDDVDPAFLLVTFFCLLQHWFNAKDFFMEKFGTYFEDYDDIDLAFYEHSWKIFSQGVRPLNHDDDEA